MQEKNTVSKEYFKVAARFADLLNGYIYRGQQIVKEEDVQELDPTISRIASGEGEVESQFITADVLKELHHSMRVTIVFLENQTDIHYAMPVRIMNEESIYYHTQWRATAKKHEQFADVKGAELISGFAKDDKLLPVITIVVYWGKRPWNGPRCLKDMLDVSDYPLELQSMIVDYPIHLLEIRKYEHLEYFHTDLKYVFGFLQREKNKMELKKYIKKNAEVFSHLAVDAYDMVSVMSRSRKLIARKKKYEMEGECDMCQAIDEIYEDGVEMGRKEGRKEGKEEGRREERKKLLFVVLKRLGNISEELRKKIHGEKNLSILEVWFQNAVDANSIEDFEQKMQTF